MLQFKKNAIFWQFHDSGFIKMVWKTCIVALEQFPLVRQEAELSELGKSVICKRKIIQSHLDQFWIES